MNKGLLLFVIFLGVFSIIKIVTLIAYSFMIKPQRDENGNFIKRAEPEHSNERDDFWDDGNW